MRLKRIWGMINAAFSEFSEDNVFRLSAALSYYTVFSLAPILLISIAIAGMVFGREAAQGGIVNEIKDLLGDEGAQAVQAMVANAWKPKTGAFATVIGILTLLFGATGVIIQLQDSLNTIWGVKPKPGQGLWGMIRNRFLSFTVILAIGFLLLVTLVINAALSALGTAFGGWLASPAMVLNIINFVISIGISTLLFALIYKVLPGVKIAWGDVWVGAVITALLFALGKYLIGLYLGHSTIASAYGAAGSLVVILVWVYYSAVILFLGAEFTQVYANSFGSRFKARGTYALEERRAAKETLRREQASGGRPEGPIPEQREDAGVFRRPGRGVAFVRLRTPGRRRRLVKSLVTASLAYVLYRFLSRKQKAPAYNLMQQKMGASKRP